MTASQYIPETLKPRKAFSSHASIDNIETNGIYIEK